METSTCDGEEQARKDSRERHSNNRAQSRQIFTSKHRNFGLYVVFILCYIYVLVQWAHIQGWRVETTTGFNRRF